MRKYKVYNIDYYRRADDTFPCCYDSLVGENTDLDAITKAFTKMDARGFECVVISYKEVDETDDGCYPFTLFYTLTKSRN